MNKNYYDAFGLNICSIGIPDETADNAMKDILPDVTIRFGKVNLSTDELIKENFKVTKDSIYINDNIAKVKIYKGREIVIDPDDNVDKNIFAPQILGTPLALLLHQRGLLVLHGSAVEVNGSATGFLGHSGMGKSTTIFALYKNGFNFFADEFIVIKLNDEGLPTVFPGFPILKLSKDIISNFSNDLSISNLISVPNSDKYSYKIDQRAIKTSLPLKQVYVIDKGKKTRVNELKPQEALINLLEHSYCIGFKNLYDVQILSMCTNLVKNIKIDSLEIPHSFEKLSEIVRIVK